MRCPAPMVRHQECKQWSPDIGIIAYFYRTLRRSNLISKHVRFNRYQRNKRRIFSVPSNMHLTGALLAGLSFAYLTGAFSFTVWLGDRCTDVGGRISDEQILVFPQPVGADGCMV